MCQSNAAMCSADFYSLCWVSSVDRKHDRWKTFGGGGGGANIERGGMLVGNFKLNP